MKNNKGFTLVELLAVIVILALIITIAVPGTISISNKMKQKMYESKLDFIKTAAKLYGEDHRDKLADGKETTITVKELAEGNYLKKDQKKAPYIQDPRNKNNSLDNMNVTIALKNNRIYVSFDGTTSDDSSNKSEETYICKKATTLHQEQCADSSPCYELDGYGIRGWIDFGNIQNYLYTGDAFDCDVNGDGIYDSKTERFYYVSDYYNTKTKSFDSNYATLIYYSNVSGGSPNSLLKVHNDNAANVRSNGPVTAIEQLPTTSQWPNITLKDTTRNILDVSGNTLVAAFNYEGYAARLLTYQEVDAKCDLNNLSDKCLYLLENTSYSYAAGDATDKYWLENVCNPSNNNEICEFTDASYTISSESKNISYSYRGIGGAGVRPAIDVAKSDIEY